MNKRTCAMAAIVMIVPGLAAAGCSGGSSAAAGVDGGGTGGGGTGGGGTSGSGGAAGNGGSGGNNPDGGNADGAAATPRPPFASGTRLQADVHQSADGAELFHVWHDSARNENCSFKLAEDGTVRCLPINTASVNLFADPDCKLAVITGSDACNHAYVAASAACGKTQLYKRGNPITDVQGFFHLVNGACVTTTAPSGSLYAGVSQDPTAFVGAQKVIETRGGGVGAAFYQGEDGSVQEIGMVDTSLGQDCLYDGARCVPATIAAASIRYASDQCTQLAVPTADPSCGVSSPAVVGVPDACGATSAYYQADAALSTAPYVSSGGTCQLDTNAATSSLPYVTLGQTVDGASFPDMTTVDDGTGRLVVRYTAAGGAKVRPLAFYDTTLATACDPQPTSMGTRCVPRAPVAIMFGDSSCSSLVYQRIAPAGCALPPVPSYVVSVQPPVAQCGVSLFAAAQVGAQISSSAPLFIATPIGCMPAPTPPQTELYATTWIDPTDLAPLSDVVK